MFTKSLAYPSALIAVALTALSGCTPSESIDHQVATHKSLQDLQNVAFVPTQDFLLNPGAGRGFKISPGGKWISWESFDAEGRFVFSYRHTTGNSGTAYLRSNEPAKFLWGNFDRHIYIAAGGRLYRFDSENPEKPHRDVTPRGFSQWDLSWRPKFVKGRWLIGSRDRNPAFMDLYWANADGSEKQLLARNPGTVIGWSLDFFGKFFWRRSRAAGGTTLHEHARTSSETLGEIVWQEVFTTGPYERLTLISSPSKSGRILALSDRGRNALALVAIDPEDGSETVIAENPNSDVESVLMSDVNHHEPALVWFTKGRSRPRALSPWGEKFLALLADGTGETDFARVVSHSKNHRFLMVATSSDFGGTDYHLFDMFAGKREKVGSSPLSSRQGPLSRSEPVTIKASDGLELPSILTLPNGVEAKRLPMVLLIHGGPADHDLWGPDNEAQFLANRGYAVLQVNYRGSSGFGKAHQKAGYRQFGRGIQTDLVEAVKWAIDEGIADPDAIAAVGASFGGYASLMALAQNDELFAAGISAFGPTDLHYQTQNSPFTWQLFGHLWTRYFGNPDVPQDAEIMKRLSPIALVDAIKDPVLLIHGKLDPIVGVEQTEKLAKVLTLKGNKPETLYFENEAHGISRYSSHKAYFSALERFLAEHLGGRMTLPAAP